MHKKQELIHQIYWKHQIADVRQWICWKLEYASALSFNYRIRDTTSKDVY